MVHRQSSAVVVPPERVADAFARALELARTVEGATAPNPPVAAVLLSGDGHILAEGVHLRAGAPHAEVAALEAARTSGVYSSVRVAIVTLEPCNHTGRTGPCSAALAESGVESVWYALPDPNPAAAGGAAALRAAGIEVYALPELAHPERDRLVAAAKALLLPFATRVRTGRPLVTVKQALTPTGSMIPPPGQKTFTGLPALRFAHEMRRRADAILTGSGTVLADQPLFSVRHVPDVPGKRRPLYLLDRRGRVGSDYIDAAAQRGLDVEPVESLEDALARLARRGGLELLVEAGPTVLAALEASGRWDRWITIHQSHEPRAPDRVTIRHAGGDFEEIRDVFRDH